MSHGFNESTYAQVINGEIVNWLRERGEIESIPLIPTLKREAELGYDVHIPAQWGIIYIQYKIPEFMVGANAREYPHFGTNYFRFTVKTDQTGGGHIQHNVLCELEERVAEENGLVCYMAPCFTSDVDFERHFIAEEVLDNSVYASPQRLGKVREGDLHRYAYTGLHDVHSFSEPLPGGGGAISDLIDPMVEVAFESRPVSLAGYINQQVEIWELLNSEGGSSLMGQEGPEGTPLGRLWLGSASLGLQPILMRFQRQ